MLRVTGNTFPYETTVSVETDSTVAHLSLSGPTGELPLELTVTGPHRLTIQPTFAPTGSATVQVLQAP